MTKFPVKGGGLAVAALLLNALVWGVSWWPFKILESQGLHPLWATALIYGLSLCVVFALRPQALRGWKQHPWLWLLLLSSGLTNVGLATISAESWVTAVTLWLSGMLLKIRPFELTLNAL